jgi:hypothetical protein
VGGCLSAGLEDFSVSITKYFLHSISFPSTATIKQALDPGGH